MKLSKDLKQILTGLAYQHAGDFLSRSEKMRVLDGDAQKPLTDNHVKPIATMQTVESSKDEINDRTSLAAAKLATVRHIAFVSNGEGINAPLDYAIESSLSHNAQIDLLIHGVADAEKVTSLEKKIRDAGVRFQRIQFDINAVDSMVDYVTKLSSLIFIISTPEDTVVKSLIEESSAKRSNRMHVPFVLIKDEITVSALKQTAA